VTFRASDYGADVARILALDGNGTRPMALVSKRCVPKGCVSEAAREEIGKAQVSEAARAGLYLYFSCEEEAHAIAQDLNTTDGSFWHGILHRQEPDAANAGYWFRQVGKHAIFPALRDEARRLGFDTGAEWDPMKFIDFCESAGTHPGSEEEGLAMQVQLVEWQLLFDHCAREKTS
jgi:hypothetical protein